MPSFNILEKMKERGLIDRYSIMCGYGQLGFMLDVWIIDEERRRNERDTIAENCVEIGIDLITPGDAAEPSPQQTSDQPHGGHVIIMPISPD